MLMKLMILALIAAFVGLFFIKGPNGQPIMTLEDFKACVKQLKMDEEAFNLDLSDAQVDALVAKHFPVNTPSA